MKKNIRLILLVVLAAALLFAACDKEAILSYEGELQFTGLDEDFSIAYDDIYAMDAVLATVNNITSDGEERVNEVEGVKLNTLLNEHGLSQKDFSGIRLVAGDGYAMDVPYEVFAEKDIILAYKFDGENLAEKKMPLRAAIDDVRSMYYVSNLAEIQFSMGQKAGSDAGKIVFMETAYLDLQTESYTYYDSEDEIILAADLLDAYVNDAPDKMYLLANDGYDKTESFDVVKGGYIKITGKDAPLFTGIDLPVGMNVKYIMNMQADKVSFVSIKSSLEALEGRTIDDKKGVAFDKLVDMANLNGEYYVISANDGYSVEVGKDSLSQAVVYMLDEGGCAVKFGEGYPKSVNIKNLLCVELGDGANCVTGAVEVSTDEKEEEQAAWTITFEGLSDGSFDFTSDRAKRKLELVSLHTERMKNDEVKPEDWKGYRLLDVLDFLHVDDFNSLVITAGDGYELELTKDMVDEETILAVEKNGEALADADNLVQLVQNTEFSTTWVKGVVKVTVK